MKKSNLILIAVLAILALFFYMDTQRQEIQRVAEVQERRLLGFDNDEIAAITIERSGENPIRAQRDNETWRLTQPVNFPGDKQSWDAIVNTIGGGERQQIIDSEPDDLEAYGLVEPRVTATFARMDSSESVTLAFGNETPLPGFYYALIVDSSQVATVRASLYNAINKNLYELRDKTVLALETDEVQRVEVKSQKANYTLERRGEDEWLLTEPIHARAEEASVRSLISSIRNAEIQQFIDDSPDMPEAYGLVEPATQLTFWVGEAGNPSSLAARALLVGATTQMEQLYAKRDGQENVFTIDPRDLNALPTSIEALRKKQLTPLRSWNVLSLAAHRADETILSVSKDSGDWFMQHPNQEMADFSRTSEIIRKVVNLQAVEFVEGETEDYGLDSPDVVFELSTSDQEDAIALAAHRIEDGTKSVKVYYGARYDPLEIYRVEAFAVDEIIEALEALAAGEPAPITPVEAPSLSDPGIDVDPTIEFEAPTFSDDDLWEGWNFIDSSEN